MELGSEILPGGGVRFSVWAPRPSSLELRLAHAAADVAMRREGDAWSVVVPSAGPGARYFYVVDGERLRPDPRSRFQPEGVYGPSQVVDAGAFQFRHPAPHRRLADLVIYELHVGTFTAEGTYAAAAAQLSGLAHLGVTAIELMPVATFSGSRNWGYDGVYLYAPAPAYGTPDDLRRLVDAAHGQGLAVIQDVVYNHLGPEGNTLGDFAPYQDPARQTLWGDGIDFGRLEVRAWITDNALMWRDEYRMDALRVDAVHAIQDDSPRHILAELTERARPLIVIAETDMNDLKVFDEWGFDACWSDDFHHALHAALTGERHGYYRDFGDADRLARAIQDGWIRGPHPWRSSELEGSRLVIATQTHDQVGNRASGERLVHLTGRNAARLAAVAALAAAPAVPLLFMGEEFAATTPFLYFTDHQDADLGRAVAEGRRREFDWQGVVPDPQQAATFLRSRLVPGERELEPHAQMLRLYRDLLTVRRRPPLGAEGKLRCRAHTRDGAVWVERDGYLIVLNLGREAVKVHEHRTPILHTNAIRYGGSVEPRTHVVPAGAAAIYGRPFQATDRS